MKAAQRKALYVFLAAAGAVATAFNVADAESVKELVTAGENIVDVVAIVAGLIAMKNVTPDAS